MASLVARYRAFFRLPDVVRLLAMAFLARMPVGMLSLALLMHLRETTRSFAVAGALVGTYLVAMATAAPVQGRIIDRYGPTWVLRLGGIVQPLALLGLLAARWLAVPGAALTAFAIVAGACMPPLSVLTRTLWRHRFEDENRRTAFALDAVLIELNFTLGPALIALLLAVASPAAALAVAIGFAAAAAPLFLASPARRYWQHERPGERHWLGPLTEPQLLLVFASNFALTFALGLLEVGYPGFAARAGVPAFGGVLIAVNSIGSAVGGIAYGGLSLRSAPERQLAALLGALAVPVALHVPFVSPLALLPLAFGAGLFIAPAFTIFALLVSHHAPTRYATEAFTWSSSGIVAGIGAGMATGGTVIDNLGASAPFALSAGGALLAAALALRVRPTRGAR